MSDTWYYADGGDSRGPFTEAQLRDMAANRTISGETLIWSEELGEWRAFSATRLSGGSTAGAPPAVAAPSGPRSGGYDPRHGTPSVGFGDAVRMFFQKYATFSGRATRPEFWWPVLFLVIVGIVTGVVDAMLFGGEGMKPVTLIFQLAVLIPSIAVSVRRLHDTDRSGWWILIGLIPIIGAIVLLVFYLQKGADGQNRFG